MSVKVFPEALFEQPLNWKQYIFITGFPGGSVVKNPPALQEAWVQSLCQEDHLKKEVAAHSSILAWRVPWTEEPGGLWSMGSHRAGHDRSNLARTSTKGI